MAYRVLYRDTKDRVVAGVASGLANYFEMDPIIMRVLFVLLTLLGGGGIIGYIILWILVPEQARETHEFNDMTDENQETQPNPPVDEKENLNRKKNNGNMIAGLILITLGTLFLMSNYIPQIDFSDLWPVVLIVIGIVLLGGSVALRKSNEKQE